MLVVEDGTGLMDAESYASLAQTNAYHSAMGNSWAGGDDAKEAALRRATQYIDTNYRFKSEPVSDSQALEWPRSGYSWPERSVVKAAMELAAKAIVGDLYADVEASAVQSETVGPISVTYAARLNGGQKRFTVADRLLAGLVYGQGQARVARA